MSVYPTISLLLVLLSWTAQQTLSSPMMTHGGPTRPKLQCEKMECTCEEIGCMYHYQVGDRYLLSGRLYLSGEGAGGDGGNSSGRILHSRQHLPLDRWFILGQMWGMRKRNEKGRKGHSQGPMSKIYGKKLKVMLISFAHGFAQKSIHNVSGLGNKTNRHQPDLSLLSKKLFLSLQSQFIYSPSSVVSSSSPYKS